MHVKRRRLPNFEACSVALFASLALYGPLPSKAQNAASSPSLSATSAAGGAGASPAIPANRWTAELRQAFDQLDADADRQLSRKEASASPGLARRFDQIDSNKDGSISSAEFDESLK